MFTRSSSTFEVAAQKAKPQGPVSEQEPTPSERLLMAIEMIGSQGPLTYKQLERALRLSKAATWRIVATLREARWVCFRQNGRLIALDPRVDELFAAAHFADAEFTELAAVIAEVATLYPVHLDLYASNRRGELILQETSRRVTNAAPVLDVSDENLIVAIHAAMTPPQLERYLSQVSTELDGEIRPHLTVGTARRRIQQFPGYCWGSGGKYLCVSVRGKMGSATAIRISAKVNAVKPELIAQAYARLSVLLYGKVESFGAGRPNVDLP